ncbi:DUF397 domain-containing protein [Streptomyces sp. SGAir0957]
MAKFQDDVSAVSRRGRNDEGTGGARAPHDIARWRKSSHSNGDGGHCVEVAEGIPGIVPVRDSKDPAGPVIVVADTTWSAFITGVRRS